MPAGEGSSVTLSRARAHTHAHAHSAPAEETLGRLLKCLRGKGQVSHSATRTRTQPHTHHVHASLAFDARTLTSLTLCTTLVAFSPLQRGETLARLLKRLGGEGQVGRAVGRRERLKQQQARKSEGTGDEESEKGAEKGEKGGEKSELFTRIMGIADQLVEEGEMDVYEGTKEDFDKFAAMWLPKQKPQQAQQGGGSARTAGDDDDDMFASDDGEGKNGAVGAGVAEGGSAEGGKGGAAAHGKKEEDPSDYANWPVKELQRFLKVCVRLCTCARACG